MLCNSKPGGGTHLSLQSLPPDIDTATNVCCESTARDAMQMNYRVIFIADGNAALTDEEHNATLNNMVTLFADVMTIKEVVGFLGSAGSLGHAAE